MITLRRTLPVLGVLVLLSGLMLGQAILPMPRENLFWRSAFDAAHVPVFGVFALVVRLMLDWLRERPSLWHDLLALIAAGSLGALVEVAQSFTGRDAALMDLVRDLLGAVVVLLVARGVVGRPWQAVLPRVILVLLALGLAGWALRTPVEGMLAYRERAAAFPAICIFDEEWIMRFIDSRNVDVELVAPPAVWDGVGAQRVARLTYQTTEYPAFILRETHPDWTSMDTLIIEIFNPGDEAIPFTVRVDDQRHNGSYVDRYGGRVTANPGASQIEISLQDVRTAPRGREMDMSRIRSFTLFAAKPPQTRVVYLSRIYLR